MGMLVDEVLEVPVEGNFYFFRIGQVLLAGRRGSGSIHNVKDFTFLLLKLGRNSHITTQYLITSLK